MATPKITTEDEVVEDGGKREVYEDAPDFVAQELFKRHKKKAELIPLSLEFRARPLKDQIEYLHKGYSTYHDAAMDLNKQNVELNRLLFAKEDQLKKALAALGTDRAMIQKQLIRENESKQKLLEENVGLRREIAGLKKQLAS